MTSQVGVGESVRVLALQELAALRVIPLHLLCRLAPSLYNRMHGVASVPRVAKHTPGRGPRWCIVSLPARPRSSRSCPLDLVVGSMCAFPHRVHATPDGIGPTTLRVPSGQAQAKPGPNPAPCPSHGAAGVQGPLLFRRPLVLGGRRGARCEDGLHKGALLPKLLLRGRGVGGGLVWLGPSFSCWSCSWSLSPRSSGVWIKRVVAPALSRFIDLDADRMPNLSVPVLSQTANAL